MARQLRIEYPGAVYHVMSRGNERRNIYRDELDYNAFLEVLGIAVERYNWLCHAYCLMGNHYHLLLETPDGNLSRGMRHVNGVYSQKFNRRHGRVGHLMQGRYKAMLVEKETYLLEVARYIVLNPVRARMVERAGDYRWSSYRATAGTTRGVAFLTTHWVLRQFGTEVASSRISYVNFIAQGEVAGITELDFTADSTMFVGNDDFTKSCLSCRSKDDTEIPREQRFADHPPLDKLFAGRSRERELRNSLIEKACHEYGYTLVAVAEFLGLHYSTVSKILRAGNSRFKT